VVVCELEDSRLDGYEWFGFSLSQSQPNVQYPTPNMQYLSQSEQMGYGRQSQQKRPVSAAKHAVSVTVRINGVWHCIEVRPNGFWTVVAIVNLCWSCSFLELAQSGTPTFNCTVHQFVCLAGTTSLDPIDMNLFNSSNH
jgi:hypothetical protein